MPRWAVAFIVALVAFLLDVLLTPQLGEPTANPLHVILMVVWIVAVVAGIILLIMWLVGRDGTRL